MKPVFRVPSLLLYAGYGLLAVAAVVALAFLINRDKVLRLEGPILKVRTIATDDAAAVAVVDFRVRNPSAVLFQVKELTLTATLADGSTVEGVTTAEMDVDRVLAYHKTSGPRYNPVLKPRDKLRPGSEQDRTAAASFPLAEARLAARRNLVLRITDVDGGTVELSERPH